MGEVRLIRKDELKYLLSLYEHLNKDDPVMELDEKLQKHWEEIISHPDYFYLLS